MDFSSKKVKRSIRKFQRKVTNLSNAGHQVYQTRINELVNLINGNEIINYIVGSYFEIEVDFDEIENNRGGWINLNLPEEEDLQIAYVFQILKKSKEGEFRIADYAHHIFRNKNLNYNINEWNTQILIPCLQTVLDKLNDLIEDEVEGKDVVSSSQLSIINYGDISAEQGNIALGKEITQKVEIDNISDIIVERAVEKNVISEEEREKVRKVSKTVEEELKKDFPSKSKLKSFAENFFDIGKKALLGITLDVITDPNWIKAVNEFLMSNF
jgi:hypothetical protein